MSASGDTDFARFRERAKSLTDEERWQLLVAFYGAARAVMGREWPEEQIDRIQSEEREEVLR